MRKFLHIQLWNCEPETFNWEICVCGLHGDKPNRAKGDRETEKSMPQRREAHKQSHENVIKFNWDWNIAGGHVSTSSSSSMCRTYVFNYFDQMAGRMRAQLWSGQQWQKLPPPPPPPSTTANNRLRKTNRDSLTDWLIRICFCFVVSFFIVCIFCTLWRRRRSKKH